MPPTRVIVSCLVSDGDKYLFITQNKPGGAYPRHAPHPRRRARGRGRPRTWARRAEVREEVGLEISNIRPFDFDWDIVDYKGEPTQLVFLRFLAERLSGEAIAASDAKAVISVPAAELANHPHNPPSQRLLTKLGLLPS